MSTNHHSNHSDPHDDPNNSDGDFWIRFWVSLALTLFLSVCFYFTHRTYLQVILIVSMIAIGLIFYFGAEALKVNEIGAYSRNNEFTHKYKLHGGFLSKKLLSESIHRFNAGEFTLDVEYSDLTLPNDDNAEGKVQLTFKINPNYFEKLFQITEGKMEKDAVLSTVQKKLNETVKALLSQATTSVEITVKDENGNQKKVIGIPTGADFEITTQLRTRVLQKKLKQFLTSPSEATDEEMENSEPQDCFGLELVKVEIPSPTITGKAYEVHNSTKASIQGQKLAIAEIQELAQIIKELVAIEKENLGISENQALPPDVYARVRKDAKNIFYNKKGIKVEIYEGLENTQTIKQL